MRADVRPDEPVTRAELVAVLEEARNEISRLDFSGGVCFAIRLAARKVGWRVARRKGGSKIYANEDRLRRGVHWWFRQWFAPARATCGEYWWDYPGYGYTTKLPRLVAIDLALLIARGR